MATKLQKMHNQLNENFRPLIDAAFKGKFGIEIETVFNWGSMRLISVRTDGEPFTPEQEAFLSAYGDGYAAAMNQVRD